MSNESRGQALRFDGLTPKAALAAPAPTSAATCPGYRSTAVIWVETDVGLDV